MAMAAEKITVVLPPVAAKRGKDSLGCLYQLCSGSWLLHLALCSMLRLPIRKTFNRTQSFSFELIGLAEIWGHLIFKDNIGTQMLRLSYCSAAIIHLERLCHFLFENRVADLLPSTGLQSANSAIFHSTVNRAHCTLNAEITNSSLQF